MSRAGAIIIVYMLCTVFDTFFMVELGRKEGNKMLNAKAQSLGPRLCAPDSGGT